MCQSKSRKIGSRTCHCSAVWPNCTPNSKWQMLRHKIPKGRKKNKIIAVFLGLGRWLTGLRNLLFKNEDLSSEFCPPKSQTWAYASLTPDLQKGMGHRQENCWVFLSASLAGNSRFNERHFHKRKVDNDMRTRYHPCVHTCAHTCT